MNLADDCFRWDFVFLCLKTYLQSLQRILSLGVSLDITQVPFVEI